MMSRWKEKEEEAAPGARVLFCAHSICTRRPLGRRLVSWRGMNYDE